MADREFTFEPAEFVPFRDKAICQKIRSIRREDIDKHPNPDFKIRVFKDMQIETIVFADLFYRLKTAMDAGEDITFIMGNPVPSYINLAHMINRFRLNCKTLWVFMMDEWADQDGNIAPESYGLGFRHAFMKYFYFEIDEDIRTIHSFQESE